MSVISRIKNWIAGETLTAADLNAEFNNIINNLKSINIDDSSEDLAAMQGAVDPFPAESASLAITLEGELHRLRYVLKQLTKTSQWYIHSDLKSKTEAYPATLDDKVILCDATGGAFTVTLPTAVGNTDKVFVIKKTDVSANIVTIDGNDAEEIDGVITQTLSSQYDFFAVVSDGANWQVIAGIAGGGVVTLTATQTLTNKTLTSPVINTPTINYGQGNLQSIRDTSRGLIIVPNSPNPLYQVDIDADEIILQDSSGNSAQVKNADLTADVSAPGANGLDAGSEAADTFYYIYVILKSGDGTVASLLSLSPTAPTMPSGYDYKALVGAVRNDNSSNFIPFRKENGFTFFDAVQTIKDGSFATSAWTAQSLAAIFPATAKNIIVSMGSGGSTTGLSPRSDGHAGSYFRAASTASNIDFGGVMPTARDNWSKHYTRYEDTIYYYVTNANSTMVAVGWKD